MASPQLRVRGCGGGGVKVLVTGANGFIGGQACAALRRAGADVLAVGRADVDFRIATASDWRSLLAGVDAVVNCAGIFADTGTARVDAINARGAAALFQACAEAGVRRVVHLSAIGAGDALTPFAKSKLAAERALQAHDLDWVILRPSIVFGAAASGGSGLLRGLAALPVLPAPRRAGPLQVVALEDVTATIVALVAPASPSRIVLDLVGSERTGFAETVQIVRRWLGWKPSPVIAAPEWLMHIGYALGDLAAWLGWRTPVRTDARRELERGAAGEAASWSAATGLTPLGLSALLPANGASAQDRLYAALYFLQPLILAVTSLFFIGTGVTSIGPGYDMGVAMLERGGLGAWSGPSVIAGGWADIAAGLAIA